MSFSIEVDLNAFLYNVKVAKNDAKDKKICAVVKADAYGHGAKYVCRAIENQVDYFAVATASEGKNLRKYGIKKSILVLAPTDSDVCACIDYGLTLGVGSIEQVKRAVRVFNRKNKSCPIHIQIDSGMHRFGFCSVVELENAMKLLKDYTVNGVYSHVYSVESYQKQISRFIPFEQVVKTKFRDAISHISSTMYIGNSYGDMVRLGIGLYGYPREKFQPAMQICSEVLDVKQLPPLSTCGYDGIFLSGKTVQKIAIVKGGYADGILRNRRGLSGVLFDGEILPIIAVCMDSVIVKADNFDISRGDKVYFVGKSGELEYYFDEIARQVGTIPYELMTNLSKRARRKYVDIKS